MKNFDNQWHDYKPNKNLFFKNKYGEHWVYKPNPRPKSYTKQVLDYLADEYGLQYGILSRDAIERLLDMIDSTAWAGNNVPNSAALVMEQLWQNGFPRPDTN